MCLVSISKLGRAMHNSAAPIRLLPGKVITNMTKSTKTTITVAGTTIKATPVRRKVKALPTPVVEVLVTEAPVAETVVAEAAPVTEVPVVVEVAEAQKAEAIFIIPDLGVSDLVMSREGFKQLPGKTWHRLSAKFGKPTVRQAVAIMVGLELRLPLAMELATWPAFRPYMVGQLTAVKANQDVLIVLEWVWGAGEGWTWKEAYTAFPRVGVPGGKATLQEIGKLNKLVNLLDGLRKEGKTSIRGMDLLAQAANLIGWIK